MDWTDGAEYIVVLLLIDVIISVIILDYSLVRNNSPNSSELLVFDKPPSKYSQDLFTPAPVKKGSLVIIHGLVVHQSESNLSDKSRLAYTFHVMETENVKYSPGNWLQLPEGENFPELF